MKYDYELLHQFEVIFRDGEHKTQAATRDYQQVWKNVIDNPPAEGITPVIVYRMNGEACAAIAGMDDLIGNVECAMEISRLAVLVRERESLLLQAELRESQIEGPRLREYQRALLWCYGWINYALSEGLSPLEFAKYIEDDKWHKVGALVGEASDEVEP